MQMNEYKGAGNGNVQGSYVNDDEFVDRQAGTHNLASKYIGTPADQHDMSVLGRNQVLRVSMLSTRDAGSCVRFPLTIPYTAQLSLHLHCGVL